MKIGMIDVHNQNYEGIYDISAPIKRAYCQKHGYEFVEYVADMPLIPESRQYNWSRVQGIIYNLHRFDWLFYLDTDILIMNDSHRIEDFIDNSYDMVVGPLPSEGHIMTSGMLIRNCRWSYEFMLDMYAQTEYIQQPYYSPEGCDATGTPCTGGYYFEQSSFHHLFDSVKKYRDRIKRVERRHFNSETKSYTPGDFLIHFPGQVNKTRLMRAMLERGHDAVVEMAYPVDTKDYLSKTLSDYEKIKARNMMRKQKLNSEAEG